MLDYHLHTRLCNHAEGSMTAYVRRAVARGMKEICFLEHLTLTESGRAMSMRLSELPLYFEAVQALKRRHRGRIDVKCGLEISFDPQYADTFAEVVGTYAFDAVGCSLHFPETIDRGRGAAPGRPANLSVDEVYAIYLQQMLQMLDWDFFDIVCHLDLVKKHAPGSRRCPVEAYDRIVSRIRQRDLTVELNTSGWDHVPGEPYPAMAILAKLSAAGVGVTLGSDAHHPDQIGRHYGRALALLRSVGYTHLVSFDLRRRTPVSIKTAETVYL
jgi:histidinol-phosphatase (PHP family)